MERLAGIISLKPSAWLLYGTALYLLNLLVGPYTYWIRDWNGIYYFGFCWLVLFFSMFAVENFSPRTVPPRRQVEMFLTRKAERKLIMVMTVMLLAAVVVAYYFTFIAGLFEGDGATDLRMKASISKSGELGEGAGWLMRLATIIALGAPSTYLLVAQLKETNYRVTRSMALLCLFLPGAFVLAQGARNNAIFVALIAIVAGVLQVKRSLPFLSPSRRQRLIVYVAVGFVAFYSMTLFIYRRGARTSQELTLDIMTMRLQSGTELVLRDVYREVDKATGNRLSAPFMASFYLGHSLPVFSSLYSHSDYDEPFWGAYHFRFFAYVLQFIGIPVTRLVDIVESQPFYGLYPTAVQGFLLDFGLYFGVLAIGVFGVILAFIYRKAMLGNHLALWLLPICLIMAFVFPIYPVTWGSSDGVIVFIVATYLFLGKGGVFSVEKAPPLTGSPSAR